MATTGKFNGTLIRVDTEYNQLAEMTMHSLTVNGEMIDTTTKSSLGWKDILPGLKDWSVEAEGNVLTGTSDRSNDDLIAWIGTRKRLNIQFYTAIPGDKTYTGSGYVTNVSTSAPLEDVCSFSVSIQGDGPITETTQS